MLTVRVRRRDNVALVRHIQHAVDNEPLIPNAKCGELAARARGLAEGALVGAARSEEHTSELQSRLHLVCRLLLEKKNTKNCSTPNALDWSLLSLVYV